MMFVLFKLHLSESNQLIMYLKNPSMLIVVLAVEADFAILDFLKILKRLSIKTMFKVKVGSLLHTLFYN